MRIPTFARCTGLVLTLFVLAGCARSERASKSTSTGSSTHDLRGEIISLDPTRHTLRVHHEAVPGYMPAMTMDFSAPDTDLSAFQAGHRIAARMRASASGELHLEAIREFDPQRDREITAAALALRQDTHVRAKHAYREIGETVPAFALYNQDGAVVRFEQFRGKRVVLNFIYTRCPVASMCPAATAKMMALQAAARTAGLPDVEFVSISFDAEYDTPAVLKAYATTRGIDLTNFSFLSGPESAIADLLVQFGVSAPTENIFRHTLATILIGRDGRILHRADDSQWSPDDFLRLIQ